MRNASVIGWLTLRALSGEPPTPCLHMRHWNAILRPGIVSLLSFRIFPRVCYQNLYLFFAKCYLLSFFFKYQPIIFVVVLYIWVGSTQFIYIETRIVIIAEKVWKGKFVWPRISNMERWWLKNSCLLISSEQWRRMPLFLHMPENISCQLINLIWILMERNDGSRRLAE